MKLTLTEHSPCSHHLTEFILFNYCDLFIALEFVKDLAVKGIFLHTMKYFSAKK